MIGKNIEMKVEMLVTVQLRFHSKPLMIRLAVVIARKRASR